MPLSPKGGRQIVLKYKELLKQQSTNGYLPKVLCYILNFPKLPFRGWGFIL
jgi:hypothetical protein